MSLKFFSRPWFPLLVLLLVFPLAACKRQAAPINNVIDWPLTRGEALATTKVKTAILAACAERGWVAREVRPGLISAALSTDRNKHSAQIEIPYSGTNYSIIYKHSENLNYDANRQTIHNRYNAWVKYLRQSIEAQLVKL